ncbi:hypothetical protein VP01_4476g3 [Puccinia sorghi]|uniref:Uncharacterized protein n=1 Tax=Puccinia sorghi TaxID=27349 RepID=A0A0L6URB2_9BASI|nr:hypothetical protein VP01_4476g3 [Puccinia sorghi]
MAPHRQTRRLCLCSKCARSTHKVDGTYQRGKLLAHHTVTRHQLYDRIAHPAPNPRPPTSSSPHQSQPPAVSDPGQSLIARRLSSLNSNPTITHIMISAAVLYLFEQVPIRVVECQLQSNFDLVKPFLLQQHSNPPLDPSSLSKLPRKIETVITRLGLDSDIKQLISCPNCFATYPTKNPPSSCTSSLTDELRGHPASCGAPLFRQHLAKQIPCRYFSFQTLSGWLARFLSRPGVEDLLDESLASSTEDYNPTSVSDIHESYQWKNFRGIDGRPFTARSGNLVFGMFVDGINPYGNKAAGKHATIFFMVLVCLTLPISHRFLPANVFLVGIAPGPKEPSLTQTNWLLAPLVDDLKMLWRPGLSLSSTHRHREGRVMIL